MRTVLALIVMCFAASAYAQEDGLQTLLDGHCTAEGFSDAQCACASETFLTETQAMGLNEKDTRAAAFFWGQAGLSVSIMMAEMENLQSANPTAAMDALTTIQPIVEANCPAEMAAVEALFPEDGSLESRYANACAQGDPTLKEVCECQATALSENSDPVVFELIVDMEEAEAAGADDAMAVVAEQRGFTRDEAEELFESSEELLAPSFGPMMACATKAFDAMGLQDLMNGAMEATPQNFNE